MEFPKIKFFTRLNQFLCRHEAISKAAFTEGINEREGWEYVIYICGDCDLCADKWEKKEDW